MAIMNAVIMILIALAAVACLVIIKTIKKKSSTKNILNLKEINEYDFHLGEMTQHDLPAGYIKRDKNEKWSRRYPEAQIKFKKENSNGKESKK